MPDRSAILYRMVLPEHTCPFGVKAKALLDQHGFEVEEHILRSRDEVDAFEEEHGVATTPQVSPGQAKWSGGPAKADGQAIYFRLGRIFPEKLVSSARDFRTIGVAALILWPVSSRALGSAGIWVDTLRRGAWSHAEILAASPNRSSIEAKMAEALTAALEDASLIYPWSVMRLLPPDDAVYSPIEATLAAIAAVLQEVWRDAVVAILSVFVARRIFHEELRIHSSGSFIHLWGFLTDDYVSFAVREPEAFAEYRLRRLAELRLAPGAGAPFAR